MRKRRLLLGGLIVVLVLIVVAAVVIYQRLNKDTIQLGTTDDELAFISDRGGNWDVFILDPVGSLRNLTEAGDAQDFFHNFDFGGELVNFFTSRDGDITPGRVNVDGSDLKAMSWIEAPVLAMTEGHLDSDPAWGPGGERMVWSKIKMLSVELFIANADGSEERQLTSGSPTEYMASWAPDGQHIAYISDAGGKQNVYVMDVETEEGVQLTDNGVDDMQPVWSEDGDLILFLSEQEHDLTTGELEYFVIKPDGSDLRPFDPATETFKGDLTYSPSGTQVVYMSNEDGSWHLYVMDADGSNVERLTDGDSNNLFPAWRPVPADQQADEASASE